MDFLVIMLPPFAGLLATCGSLQMNFQFMLMLCIISAYNAARNSHYTTRSALMSPDKAPWAYLLKNADDNSYAPGATPTIRLELFPHAVVVYNNECGFSDKNIEAVCNVGGSTKANKTGYIGQKGIG